MDKEIERIIKENHDNQPASVDELLDELMSQHEKQQFGLKKMIIICLVIASIMGFGILGWFSYKSGKKPVDTSQLPVVKADSTPTKVAPEDPGGMVVPNMDKTVYNNLNDVKQKEGKSENILPAPEEPIDKEKLLGDDNKQASEVKLADNKQTTNDLIMNSDNDNNDLYNNSGTNDNSNNGDEADNTESSVPPQAEALPLKAQDKSDEAAQAKVNIEDPKKPKTTSDKKVIKPVEKKTKEKVELAKNPKTQNGYLVQLASFKSKKDAENEWKKISKVHSSLLGKYKPNIQQKDLKEKGVVYRLRAGTIKNESDARLLCKKLIELKQGCFIVRD